MIKLNVGEKNVGRFVGLYMGRKLLNQRHGFTRVKLILGVVNLFYSFNSIQTYSIFAVEGLKRVLANRSLKGCTPLMQH